MSALGATPGPWSFKLYASSDNGGLCGNSDNFHLLQGPEGDSGGSILEGSLVLADDAVNAANARLIAAAPELYRKLEYAPRLPTTFDQYQRFKSDCQRWLSERDELLAQVRAEQVLA